LLLFVTQIDSFGLVVLKLPGCPGQFRVRLITAQTSKTAEGNRFILRVLPQRVPQCGAGGAA
jgi:hypothetical protein